MMTKNKDFTSFQQFVELDGQKNSGFTKLAALLVLRQCEVSQEVHNALLDFMTELALTFQFFNDINSVENENYYKKKGTGKPGEDFYNGKINAIIIKTIENLPEKADRVKEIMLSDCKNQDIIDELIQIIAESKSIEFLKEFITKRRREKWSILDKLLPDSEYKTELYDFSEMFQKLAL